MPRVLQAFPRAGQQRHGGQVLRDVEPVRLGRVPVAFAPVDHTFEGFVEQLARHGGQHDFAEHRDERQSQAEHGSAGLQPTGDFLPAHPGVDIGGGHCLVARIAEGLVAAMLKQVGPQVDVFSPQALS